MKNNPVNNFSSIKKRENCEIFITQNQSLIKKSILVRSCTMRAVMLSQTRSHVQPRAQQPTITIIITVTTVTRKVNTRNRKKWPKSCSSCGTGKYSIYKILKVIVIYVKIMKK